jgi:hypothetical protein
MRADAEKAARPTATLDQVIARRHAVHARGMVEATQLPAAHIDAWRRRSWRAATGALLSPSVGKGFSSWRKRECTGSSTSRLTALSCAPNGVPIDEAQFRAACW